MEIKRSDNNGLTIEFSGYTLMFTWNEIEIMSAERDKWYGLQDVMDYITNEAGFYEVGLLEAFPERLCSWMEILSGGCFERSRRKAPGIQNMDKSLYVRRIKNGQT